MSDYKSDFERPYKTKPFRDRSGDGETKAKFLELLEVNHGDLHKTYTSMEIPYGRFYEWRKTDPDFDAAIDKIKLDTVRWVESKMFEKIAEGDKDLMKFYLKMHKDSQKLGYMEKQQIDTKIEGSIDVDAQIEEMKKALSEE